MLYYFPNKARYRPKIAIFFVIPYIRRPHWWGRRRRNWHTVWCGKSEWCSYPMVKKSGRGTCFWTTCCTEVRRHWYSLHSAVDFTLKGCSATSIGYKVRKKLIEAIGNRREWDEHSSRGSALRVVNLPGPQGYWRSWRHQQCRRECVVIRRSICAYRAGCNRFATPLTLIKYQGLNTLNRKFFIETFSRKFSC